MYLFSYNPHPFIFITFSYSIICFITSPSLFLLYFASQHVLWFFQHVSLLFALIYSLDVVGLAFLGQNMSKFHACAQIYMPMIFMPCLCLDLHAYAFYALFVLRSTCLCVLFHACAQIYMFILRFMCLCLHLRVCVLHAVFMCLDLYVGCHAICFYSPFVP